MKFNKRYAYIGLAVSVGSCSSIGGIVAICYNDWVSGIVCLLGICASAFFGAGCLKED